MLSISGADAECETVTCREFSASKTETMNHEISLATAVEMTTRYRSYRESILQQEYQEQDILPVCETFEKASVMAVLNQSTATHLRAYYGMDANLKVHVVLVGANEEGEDIIPVESTESDPGTILEDAQRCPPYCPPPSPLNDDGE
jgi:hypothetical protein